MTDNWDSYFCHVEGKPASILVNLGAAAEAPLAAFPVLGYVSVSLLEPDGHGFPDDREYATLGDLEDRLVHAVSGEGQGMYVGRCAVDGRFDCFFYLREASGWGDQVARAMEAFPGYSFEAGAQEDPNWASYRQFLFPAENDLLVIQNRRACRALEDAGNDPGLSRIVAHWARFSSSGAAENFSLAVRGRGFSSGEPEYVSGAELDGEGSEDGSSSVFPPGFEAHPGAYRLCFSRPDAPLELDEIVFSLADLAREHGGHYEGWAVPLAE